MYQRNQTNKMNIIDFLFGGTETINCLLLLLLLGIDKMSLERVKGQVEDYMNRIEGKLNNRKEVEEMIAWILDDNFKNITIQRFKKNLLSPLYTKELQLLKDKMINFYLTNLKEFVNGNTDIERSCDIMTTMEKYIFQLKRLRMVIEPEINILVNPHTPNSSGEQIIYLSVKSFWMGDDGKKTREITRSIGKLSNYKQGRKDPLAEEEAIKKVQPELWEKYKTIYLSN